MALRNAFAALSTEDTLAAVLQELRKHLDRKVEDQRFYLFSTEHFSLTTGGHLRGTLTNPAGSGRSVKLYEIIGFVSQGPVYLTVFQNPIGVLTSTVRRGRNANRAAAALETSSSELRFDSSPLVPLTGEIELGRFPIPATQVTNARLPPLILPPGVTLGFNISFPGPADVNLSLRFLEE